MFETVVFSGGGNRCFWQAGFWQVVSAELYFKPKRILAASGGAYVACGLFGDVMERLLDVASYEFGNNKRNFYPWRAAKGIRPFPHPPIYRSTLRHSIDAQAFERLRQAPPIFIQTALPPRFLPLPASLGFAIAGYYAERYIRKAVHSRLNRWIGFKPRWFSTHECNHPEEIIDIVCASSCVPPFFPIMKIRGKIALDGGFVDNSPVELSGTENLGRTLVLLTQTHKNIPKHPMRLYWQPRERVAVKNFDVTASQGIRIAFQQGREDGFSFVRSWASTLRNLHNAKSA